MVPSVVVVVGGTVVAGGSVVGAGALVVVLVAEVVDPAAAVAGWTAVVTVDVVPEWAGRVGGAGEAEHPLIAIASSVGAPATAPSRRAHRGRGRCGAWAGRGS